MNKREREEIHNAIVRFADGERDAFRAVFQGLWPVLVAFTHGMGLDGADAEDAAQRALLKVFSRISDLDRDRDGVTWALTLGAYEVLTLRKQRARRREAPVDAVAATPGAELTPEAHLIAEDTRRAVRDAVGDLDERDREALNEVLEDAGVMAGETARKRRFRAMTRLRAAWRKAYG